MLAFITQECEFNHRLPESCRILTGPIYRIKGLIEHAWTCKEQNLIISGFQTSRETIMKVSGTQSTMNNINFMKNICVYIHIKYPY